MPDPDITPYRSTMSPLKWCFIAIGCGLLVLGLLGARKIYVPGPALQTDPAQEQMVSGAGGTTIRTLDPQTIAKPPSENRIRRKLHGVSKASAEAGTTSIASQSTDPYISEDLRGVEPGYDAAATFAAAEQEFGVPAALLQAIAYAETEMHHGDGSSRPDGGRGIMNLRDSNSTALKDAATLLGVDKAVLVRDPVQNVRGAAALLRKHYSDAVDAGAHERPWYMALSDYSGKSAEEAVTYGEQIRNLLREGFTHTTSAGQQITLEPGQDYLLGP